MLNVEQKKTTLRKTLKTKRKKTFLQNGVVFAKVISNYFINWFDNQENLKNLAFYYPINSEVTPFPIMQSLKKKSINFCLPVVQKSNSPLVFREWKKNSKLMVSDFGAKIPSKGKEMIPDLILIPLLAYDNYGSRLGYGGGFYDRTISNLKKNSKKNIFTMGLAFSCQKYNGVLPTDKNDQKIDSVLTEEGFQFFENSN